MDIPVTVPPDTILKTLNAAESPGLPENSLDIAPCEFACGTCELCKQYGIWKARTIKTVIQITVINA